MWQTKNCTKSDMNHQIENIASSTNPLATSSSIPCRPILVQLSIQCPGAIKDSRPFLKGVLLTRVVVLLGSSIQILSDQVEYC